MLFPQASVNGARQAMLVWCKAVAPSLFPFFVLMPALTGKEACRIYERMLSGLMKKLFGMPGTAAPAALVCMLAGSPAGVAAVKRVAYSGGLQRKDVRRLAFAMCGLSPVYLILGVGQGLYGSISIGWRLAAIQMGIQILMLALSRWMGFSGEIYYDVREVSGEGGIKSAVESILAICGYMVFFGALTAPLTQFAGKKLGTGFLILTDLPGGSAELAALDVGGKILLQCAAIGFAGLCIAFQNMQLLKEIGVSWKTYLAGRGISAGLFACAGAVFMKDAVENAGIMAVEGKLLEISTLVSCFVAVPTIFYLTKNLFLNKRKDGKI